MANTRFALALAIASISAVIVDSFPLQDSKVAYTRYVRCKPFNYPYTDNGHMKEIVEVFNTKRRPPPFMFLNDEDLTRFVRCDYDPSLPGCEEMHVSTTAKTYIGLPWIENSDGSIIPETTTMTTTVASKTEEAQPSFEEYDEGVEEDEDEANEHTDYNYEDTEDNEDVDEAADEEN